MHKIFNMLMDRLIEEFSISFLLTIIHRSMKYIKRDYQHKAYECPVFSCKLIFNNVLSISLKWQAQMLLS